MREEELKEYLFSYNYGGAEWGLTVFATDPEDAQKKVKSIYYATYDGEVKMTIPVPGGNWLWRLFQRFRPKAEIRAVSKQD